MASASTAKIQGSTDDAKSRIVQNGSSFQKYPPSRPFIHDDYRRDVTKPIIAYPESNRQGVMSALKNLQDRLKQVECEKQEAEQNFKFAASTTSTQSADVRDRLVSQEERCRALQQQLEHTRVMVHQAERDRAEALRKMAALRSDNVHIENAERRSYIEKISDLEREQLRLMATQTLAQNKIKDLEEKLEDERHHRLVMQDKAHKSDTEFETTRPVTAGRIKPRRRKKRTSSATKVIPVSSRGTVGRKYPSGTKHPGREPLEHFHLNLSEIPFVTGKSTGQSHSLSANFQEVLSLMKSHNSKLCAGPSSHSRIARRGGGALHCTKSTRPSSRQLCDHHQHEPVNESVDEIVSLILQLEDEFGQLSLDREDLTRQIRDSGDQQLQNDLTKILNSIVARMEAKGEQIVKLKRCQDLLLKKGVVKRTPKSHSGRSETVAADDRCRVVLSAKTEQSRPSSSCSKAQGSLHLLKDLKKLQTSLRADDIVWDS